MPSRAVERRPSDYDMIGAFNALSATLDRQTGGDAIQLRLGRYWTVARERLLLPNQ
jgi:hypothetical protein